MYLSIIVLIVLIYMDSIRVKVINMHSIPTKVGIGVALSVPTDLFSMALATVVFTQIWNHMPIAIFTHRVDGLFNIALFVGIVGGLGGYLIYTFYCVEKMYRIVHTEFYDKMCMFLSFYMNITVFAIIIIAAANTFLYPKEDIDTKNHNNYYDGEEVFHIPTDGIVTCSNSDDVERGTQWKIKAH